MATFKLASTSWPMRSNGTRSAATSRRVEKEALGRRYQESVGDFEIKTDMHDVLANDEHAVQLMNVTATRGNKTHQYRTAEIYHMKDGKITARWAFSDEKPLASSTSSPRRQ
jgi:ketosteroid isomerase-like protein